MDTVAADIETALSWALIDELPKQALQALKDMGMMSEGPGRATGVSPMFRLAQLGTSVDFSREPGFPDAAGPPHADALEIANAIRGLPKALENYPWWTLRLDHLMGGFGLDVRKVWKRSAAAAASLVMVKGKLKTRPSIGDEIPELKPKRYEANGKVMYLRDVVRKTYKWNEDPKHDKPTVVTPFSEAAHPYKARGGGKAWPTGTYVPVVFEPNPADVLQERAEYAVWRLSMDLLVKELEGKLTSLELLPCTAAFAPWLGDKHRPAPELRVVVDQATDAKHRDEHEWALAHRLYQDELERQQHRDRARAKRTSKRAEARRDVNAALDKIAA